MKLSNVAVLLGVAAAMTSVPSHADDHREEARGNRHIGSGMHAVSTDAAIGQPGYGWRYFADERRGRAVVISPGGDYFYSHGKGLTPLFEGTAAREPPPSR